MNTADYLLQNADDDRVAIIEKKAQHTYRDLRAASARILGELLASGARPGDHIGLLAANSLFWAASYLAILKLPAVAVPLPTVATPDDLARKIEFTRLRTLLADRRSLRRVANALPANLRVRDDALLAESGPARWESATTEFRLDQDAALMLTSGTTARPRAVRITHRNIQANTNSIIEYLGLSAAERILVVLPFYYCFGTSLLHTHLRVGGSLAICNTFAYPETALNMAADVQATGIAGVPSTYQTLLRSTSLPRRELPSLKKVQQAGGKLPNVFIRELRDALPHAQIFVMYGQTEATARLSYLPPELLDEKLGSIGRGIPGVTLRVLDDLGEPVPPGKVGEIVASGENISPGYFNDPEASAHKFINGNLYTGDLATVDEDGFIYVVDRKSDFIKSLGHRVSSQEVEAKVLELPDVIAAAAIGVPDDLAGEAIKVFAVLKKKSGLTPEAIITHCKKNLPRHMVPKYVVLLDKLPLNAHGKVVKAKLREMG
jgi:acyl-CoA synthetase (AMP-forming)/AMP-acid ligase II